MDFSLSRRSFLGASLLAAFHRWLPAAPKPQGRPYVPSFLHPNDKWVLLRSDEGFWFEVIDLETGQRIHRLANSEQDTYYGTPEPYFDPSGRYVVIWSEGYEANTLGCWDLDQDGRQVRMEDIHFSDNRFPRPALPPPGGILKFADFEFDLRKARVVQQKSGGDLVAVASDRPATSRAGRAWSVGGTEKPSLFIWVKPLDSGPGAFLCGVLPGMWQPHETFRGQVGRVAARRTRDSILAWTGYSIVREVDSATGKTLRCLSGTMPQTGLLAFGADRHTLFAARPLDNAVSWHRKGKPTPIKLMDEDRFRPPITELGTIQHFGDATRETRQPHASPCAQTRCLAYGAGVLVHGNDQGRICLARLQESDGGPFENLGRHDAAIRALAVAPDQPLLLSGARDGTLKVWDLVKGQLRLELPRQETRVNSAAVVAGGVAATAGPEGIRVWDLRDGHLTLAIPTGGAWVSDVTLDPGGQFVAGALLDGSVRLWEIPSGKLRWKINPGEGWCSSLALDSVKGRLACGFESSAILLVSLGLGKIQAHTLGGGPEPGESGCSVHALAWSRDCRALAAGWGDRIDVFGADLSTGGTPPWNLALDWADYYT